jgi:cold shock CspA family protein/ribosome-associated translation inhibitor RaiA
MKLPLQITFRGLESSDALEAEIRERAGKLDHFSPDIMSCRVVVESGHKHHEEGNLYHVRVDLTVPGLEIVTGRERTLHHAHTDAYVAVRDAFDEARRQLEDYERRRRQEVKAHRVPEHGRVARLNLDEGFGFIETADGREIYFHRNSVLRAPFADLRAGQEVRFDEEPGEKGPQATTVRVVGKHHVAG